MSEAINTEDPKERNHSGDELHEQQHPSESPQPSDVVIDKPKKTCDLARILSSLFLLSMIVFVIVILVFYNKEFLRFLKRLVEWVSQWI